MSLPNAQVKVLDANGTLSLPWRLWAQGLTSSPDSSGSVSALETEVATLASELASVETSVGAALTNSAVALAATDDGFLAGLVALGQLDATEIASGVTPGSYGDATHVGQFTVNAQGELTAALAVAITFPILSFNARTGAVTLQSLDIVSAQGVSTVAALPGSPADGQRSYVTDSSVAAASNFGVIVAGAGTNHVPVYWDAGTGHWRIG